MPWNAIDASDVQAEILPQESATIAALQGSGGDLATILNTVVNECRAKIQVGGNQLDALGTVPDQLRSEIIAIARWRWFSSLPNTKLCSDQRKKQYEDAVEKMNDVEAGKDKSGRIIKVEFPNPTTALFTSGPAGQMEVARTGRRRNTRRLDGLI